LLPPLAGRNAAFRIEVEKDVVRSAPALRHQSRKAIAESSLQLEWLMKSRDNMPPSRNTRLQNSSMLPTPFNASPRRPAIRLRRSNSGSDQRLKSVLIMPAGVPTSRVEPHAGRWRQEPRSAPASGGLYAVPAAAIRRYPARSRRSAVARFPPV
jgi:hypothetical protein